MGDAIDDLIEDVTVDAYGPYEQLSSFRQVFEDTAAFPFAAQIIGVDILVEEIDYEGDDLRGLVAICKRDGQRHTVSLLDVSLAEPVDPDTAQLLAAYRRWAGADPPPRPTPPPSPHGVIGDLTNQRPAARLPIRPPDIDTHRAGRWEQLRVDLDPAGRLFYRSFHRVPTVGTVAKGERDERVRGTAAGPVLRRDLRGTRPCHRTGATHLAPGRDRPGRG